ncbi:hypothetical protein ABTW95_34285 [Spirillospora sp. NPDC127506]
MDGRGRGLQAHVVVLRTSGNQAYIFGSNKRRENVGASELITWVETRWLEKAIGRGVEELKLLDDGIEVMAAGAGAVTLIVRDRDEGKRIVGEITERALREAPGLDVCGVVGEAFEVGGVGEFTTALEKTRGAMLGVRMARPGPDLRFPGLPIAARCTSSGLPAASIVRAPKPKEGRRPAEPRSAPSIAKLDAFPRALDRLAREMGLGKNSGTKLAGVVEHLNDKAEWVAVVHADGNGMGKVFQEFPELMKELGPSDPLAYIESFRKLSRGVDECAKAAFRAAVQDLDGEVPRLLPLVLGGDDITVVCDGALALTFTERYLRYFAEETKDHDDVGKFLNRGKHGDGLGACAGVAITKRNYPFHSAAGLAEELTGEAKRVKEKLGAQRCALSFHVLYESAFADLRRLRKEMRVGERLQLTAQPYVIGGSDDDGEWAEHRCWEDLRRRVKVLTDERNGDRVIPAGQAHDLRSGLFQGQDAADARFAALRTWLGAEAVSGLTGEDNSLFWQDGETVRTGLLDAMNAVPFLRTED